MREALQQVQVQVQVVELVADRDTVWSLWYAL